MKREMKKLLFLEMLCESDLINKKTFTKKDFDLIFKGNKYCPTTLNYAKEIFENKLIEKIGEEYTGKELKLKNPIEIETKEMIDENSYLVKKEKVDKIKLKRNLYKVNKNFLDNYINDITKKVLEFDIVYIDEDDDTKTVYHYAKTKIPYSHTSYEEYIRDLKYYATKNKTIENVKIISLSQLEYDIYCYEKEDILRLQEKKEKLQTRLNKIEEKEQMLNETSNQFKNIVKFLKSR